MPSAQSIPKSPLVEAIRALLNPIGLRAADRAFVSPWHRWSGAMAGAAGAQAVAPVAQGDGRE
ncbi:MAG TPA: hypothetical protein DDW89_07670, partial [Gammaproteobacteria bacterium]|nr:hypothetical protein [Gammaproteobacteria bacterium]